VKPPLLEDLVRAALWQVSALADIEVRDRPPGLEPGDNDLSDSDLATTSDFDLAVTVLGLYLYLQKGDALATTMRLYTEKLRHDMITDVLAVVAQCAARDPMPEGGDGADQDR
jgi:hypothetical protein